MNQTVGGQIMRLGVSATSSRTASWSILQVPSLRIHLENSDSDLHQAVRAFVGPPHLLLLGHAMADNLVHCRFSNAATDRQPLVVASAIVHECTGVVVDIAGQAVQIPPQGRELITSKVRSCGATI